MATIAAVATAAGRKAAATGAAAAAAVATTTTKRRTATTATTPETFAAGARAAVRRTTVAAHLYPFLDVIVHLPILRVVETNGLTVAKVQPAHLEDEEVVPNNVGSGEHEAVEELDRLHSDPRDAPGQEAEDRVGGHGGGFPQSQTVSRHVNRFLTRVLSY